MSVLLGEWKVIREGLGSLLVIVLEGFYYRVRGGGGKFEEKVVGKIVFCFYSLISVC